MKICNDMKEVGFYNQIAQNQDFALSGFATKAREVLASNVVRVGPFILGILGQIVLTRILSPVDFGAFAFAGALLAVPAAVLGWPLHMALVQIKEAEKLEDTIYSLSLLFGIATVIIGIGMAVVFRGVYGVKVAWLMIGFSLIEALAYLSYFYEGLLKKKLTFLRLSIIRGASSTVSTFLAVAFAFLGFGVWSLLSKNLLFVTACFLAYGMVVSYRYRLGFHIATAKRVFAFSSQVFLIRAVEKLYGSLEKLILGMFGMLPSLGFYERAQYLTTTAVSTLGPITVEAAFPVYTRLQHDARLGQAFYTVSYLITRLTSIPALIGITSAHLIVPFLYGLKWQASVPLLQWLSLLIVFYPVSENCKSFLYGTGRPTDVLQVKILQVLVGAPLLVLGIVRWGIKGAAIAVVCMAGIEVVGLHWQIAKLTSIPFWKTYLKPFLGAIVSSILIVRVWEIEGAAGILGVIGVYLVLLFILERRELTDKLKWLVWAK